MNEDFDFGEAKTGNKGTAKSGRRAQNKSLNPPDAPDFEASVEDSPKMTKSRRPVKQEEDDGPPKPSRVSGWGEDNPRKSRKLGEGFENIEDERLRPRTPEDDNDSDTDIPVIPDLEEQQDDDMTVKVAIAPNVAVNRVATYRELDNDLLRQAAFTTLDNDIDLKLLTKNLSTEADLLEEDKPWDWDRLFTEVTSELLSQIESIEETTDNEVNQTLLHGKSNNIPFYFLFCDLDINQSDCSLQDFEGILVWIKTKDFKCVIQNRKCIGMLEILPYSECKEQLVALILIRLNNSFHYVNCEGD